MRGVGAGDSPALPRLVSRASELNHPGEAIPAPVIDATAGAARASAPTPAARPGKPEEEDYSYTYLAPARHKYELPDKDTPRSEDWRYLLSLGLRISAAMAVGYLIYHSDVAYLLGVTRRRRRVPGPISGGDDDGN